MGANKARKSVQSAGRGDLSRQQSPLESVGHEFFRIHVGDARQVRRILGANGSPATPFVDAIITSPPYGGLKDYAHPDQIGWAQSYEKYLQECRDVFASVSEICRPTATMWLIADTLRSRTRGSASRLLPLPFDLADQAEKEGWILRDVIVWRKDRTLPWSGRGRLRNTFEYVLQLVRGDNYKYYLDRLRSYGDREPWWVRFPERYSPLGTAPSNVWDIPIPRQGSWHATSTPHQCPLPKELVHRLLLLSTDTGDVVLDPFAGSGVVITAATELNRRAIGIEINGEYVAAFEKGDGTTKHKPIAVSGLSEQPAYEVLCLRALKLPGCLVKGVRHDIAYDGPIPRIAAVLADPKKATSRSSPYDLVEARLLFGLSCAATERSRLQKALAAAWNRRPASKFGITGNLTVVPIDEFRAATERRRLYVYDGSRHWASLGLRDVDKTLTSTLAPASRIPSLTVLSNLLVRISLPEVD